MSRRVIVNWLPRTSRAETGLLGPPGEAQGEVRLGKASRAGAARPLTVTQLGRASVPVLDPADADVFPLHAQPARQKVDEVEGVPGLLGEAKHGVSARVRQGEVGLLFDDEVGGRDLELHGAHIRSTSRLASAIPAWYYQK